MRKLQIWELSRLCPETSTKLYVHEFGFCILAGKEDLCTVYCSYVFTHILYVILVFVQEILLPSPH